MKKSNVTLFSAVTIFFLFLTIGMAHAAVPVSLFDSNHRGAVTVNSSMITQIVTQEFQLDAKDTPFKSADVKVLYTKGGQPDYLIVHLKDRLTWSFETARVNLEDGYVVSDVIMDYVPSEDDMAQDALQASAAACPDNSVQMVFATCETTINTAVQGVNAAASTAQSAGFKVRKLMGSSENISAYRNWLSCNNLILLGRIGHGSPTGIMVSGGTVSTSHFSQMNLSGKVLYFNSCQVHKNPLKNTILNAGARRFIGGICNLQIGTSEEVFKCWMKRVLSQKQGMTPSVRNCEQSTNYPEPGCHGVSGNGGSDVIDGGGPNPDPTDPNSCKGHCGKKAPGGCWCDSTCAQYGDCCKDKQQQCGF